MSDVATRVLTVRGESFYTRRFKLEVIEGPDRGTQVVSEREELTIGGERGVDLQLTDPSVSRHHCVLRASSRGLEIRDLASTNGTSVAGCEIVRAFITSGTRLRIGRSVIAVDVLADEIEQPIAASDHFGGLIGASLAMRRLYPILDRFAQSDANVLLTGETGTGKELAAEAIHEASRRAAEAFVALNCGALPAHLTESELFGHVRGAFTGADVARTGAFAEANGGTIFLDEIGELPLALQPLLLRVLETQTFRPLGGAADRHVNVRVIAATHLDLREAVNERRFRSDLYFRLHVLPLELPPLREREGDVELLATRFWRELRRTEPPTALIAELARQRWPGNVGELRNAVERAALIGWAPDEASDAAELSYGEAKERASLAWEREWVGTLLARHDGNLSAAARSARMGRTYLRKLARRHGIAKIVEGDDA